MHNDAARFNSFIHCGATYRMGGAMLIFVSRERRGLKYEWSIQQMLQIC